MNDTTTSNSPRTSRIRRLATALAVTAGSAILTLVPATTAQANVSNSAATLSAGGTCYSVEHQVYLTSSILLSSRFPNGAYVAVRYEYFWVNKYGQAISSAYTSPWSAPTWTGPGSGVINGVSYVNILWRNLPSSTLSATGILKLGAQVGVWNGKYYEYSAWDIAANYHNYGQWNQQTDDAVCLASIK
jgi:hypothetical protein